MSQVIALLVLAASLGCAASPPAAAGAPPDTAERVTLAPGESARVAGGRLQLRFDKVVSDSRCPEGEQCVWAGRAEVAITVTGDGAPVSYRLFTPGAEPNAVVHGGLSIALSRLDPYPRASRETATGDYRATFAIGGSGGQVSKSIRAVPELSPAPP